MARGSRRSKGGFEEVGDLGESTEGGGVRVLDESLVTTGTDEAVKTKKAVTSELERVLLLADTQRSHAGSALHDGAGGTLVGASLVSINKIKNKDFMINNKSKSPKRDRRRRRRTAAASQRTERARPGREGRRGRAARQPATW